MTDIKIISDAPSDVGKSYAGQKIAVVQKRSSSSKRGGSSRSSKAKYIRDTIKIDGKVIVGLTNKKTGEFVPSGKEDNASLFAKYSKVARSKKTADIRATANKLKAAKLAAAEREADKARKSQEFKEAKVAAAAALKEKKLQVTKTPIFRPEVKQTLRQQIQQKQSTTQEMRDYFQQQAEEQEAKRVKGVSFDLRGTEKVKRAFRGETLTATALGPMVAKKDGTLRPLTKAELEEISPKVTISLNPFNFGTGFLGLSKDIANFINSPNKKQQLKQAGKQFLTNPDGVLSSMLEEAVLNPFGFAGEVVAGDAVFKIGRDILKFTKKATTTSIRKVGNIIDSEGSKVSKRIKNLEDDISKLKKDKAAADQIRKKQKELEIAKREKGIIDKDLKDLDDAIKKAAKDPSTKTQAAKQVKDLKEIGKSFKSRSKARQQIQQDKAKLLEQFEKQRKLASTKPRKLEIVKKKIPSTKELLDAYYNNGTLFKKWKKQIEASGKKVVVKKVQGRTINIRSGNVVQKYEIAIKPKSTKKVQYGVTKIISTKYIRLEALEQNLKRATSLTKKAQLRRRINKLREEISLAAKKQKAFKKSEPKKELTAKEKKKIEKQKEFEEGQKTEAQAKEEAMFLKSMEDLSPPPKIAKGLFKSKKAQLQLFKTTRKAVSNANKKSSALKKREKQLGLSYRSFEKTIKGKKDLTPKQAAGLKKIKSNLDKRKTKLKKDIAEAQKTSSALKKSLDALRKLSPAIAKALAAAAKNANGQVKDLGNIQAQINAYPTPTIPKPKTGAGKGTGGAPKPGVKGKGGKTGKVPKSGARAGKKTPPPEEKNKPKPRLKLGSKLGSGERLAYDMSYTYKGKKVKKALGKPINKALRAAAERAETLSRKVRLKISGTTTQKDITKPKELKNFQVSKEGNEILVFEKEAKKALDKPLEKVLIQRARKTAALSAAKKKTTTKKRIKKAQTLHKARKNITTKKTPPKKKTPGKKAVKKSSPQKRSMKKSSSYLDLF